MMWFDKKQEGVSNNENFMLKINKRLNNQNYQEC
jgi:hypothetical protein